MVRVRARARVPLAGLCALAACLVGGAAPVTAGRPAAGDSRDPLLLTMGAELARSHEGLHIKGFPAPYFVSFQVWEIEEAEVAATLGAVFTDDQNRRAVAGADVRVGDYELDNSEDTDPSYEVIDRYQPTGAAPLDGDSRALVHSLWLLADFRYKEALLSYQRVGGRRVFDAEKTDRMASFSREASAQAVEDVVLLDCDLPAWRGLVRRASERFLAHPEIFDSEVRLKARGITRRFVSTEGAALRTRDRFYSVHVTAVTRANDGMLLDQSFDLYWRREAEAPSEADIAAAVDGVVSDLLALREAPVLDPYTGPAILAPRATGVFFHETVGHRLEGQRQTDEEEGQTFKGQMGKPVLPSFLSIVDDPTLREFEGRSLNGWYRFDEQGVASQRVDLVRDGVLAGFLLARKPVEGFRVSNGHGRATWGERPVARMGNLMVLGSGGLDDAALTRRLIEEARKQGKPFGLRIESIAGGSTNTAAYGYQAFKGTPRMVYKVDAETGEETLVRGVEFVGTPLQALNRIVAVGSRYDVFNGYCGAESGYVPVATIAPATLFDEVELQRSHQTKERPQVLPAPWSEDETARSAERQGTVRTR